MNCYDVPKIVAYVNGHVSSAAARLVKQHLLGCPNCRVIEIEARRTRAEEDAFERRIAELTPAKLSRVLTRAIKADDGVQCTLICEFCVTTARGYLGILARLAQKASPGIARSKAAEFLDILSNKKA